ncbi:MAG TPA: protease inhibitor I42 family protein [Longimicrobium sp.]|nr:protease inhibitor I42 family protein [Longimicrobium sp.]
MHPSRLLLIPLVVAGACGRGDEQPRAYSDPAQPVQAAAGETFQVTLQSNQSTGYQWVLVDSQALGPLRVAGSQYEVPRELRDRDGAGGTETWSIQALRPGEGTLSLIYVGPGENEAPRDTTRFRVVVR